MPYNFPKFIDSHAISSHIKTYPFTPAEQSVLISQSCTSSVDEKLEALEYLYEKYSEEEFGAEMVGMFGDNDLMPFRERLKQYIDGIKKSLALKTASDGYVFITSECEEGFEYSDEKYYTSYTAAYNDIVSRHNYLSTEVSDCSHEYRIMIMPEGQRCGLCHYYDDGLMLVSADPVLPNDDDLPVLDISQYYVWVPLPFKKGDIVKVTHRCGWKYMSWYAVFSYPDDESDEKFRHLRERLRRNGDRSDRNTILEYFVSSDESSVGGCFESEDNEVLELDYPNESDLDRIDYATKVLAAALDDNYNDYRLIDLLHDHSQGLVAKEKCCIDVDGYLREKIKKISG